MNKEGFIEELAAKAGITEEQAAENISNAASELIAGNIRNKLLHPFGGNDEDK